LTNIEASLAQTQAILLDDDSLKLRALMSNRVHVIVLALGLMMLLSACGGHTTTVTVTVARPPPPALPFVVGLREPLAVRMLRDTGWRVRVTRRTSTSAPRGFVFAQFPYAGAKVDQASTVTLLVSTGKH
jgi:beta-lactam-binding protein with PASTA domain